MTDNLTNNNLVLISGKSATGKSASLMNIANPNKVLYLNCEHKRLPFNAEFIKGPDGGDGFNITDPYQIFEAFDFARDNPNVEVIIIDSMTFLMDMFESMHVLPSSNTIKAWGDYAQFWKKLMNEYVATVGKSVIVLAHTMDVMNEAEMVNETLVKVKGSLMNQGIESYFSTVISTKKVSLKTLKDYESDLLNISDEEEILGFKYVFQTKLTKNTVNERIRSSLGMWSTKETYIDNDVQNVIDRLHKYYS